MRRRYGICGIRYEKDCWRSLDLFQQVHLESEPHRVNITRVRACCDLSRIVGFNGKSFSEWEQHPTAEPKPVPGVWAGIIEGFSRCKSRQLVVAYAELLFEFQ